MSWYPFQDRRRDDTDKHPARRRSDRKPQGSRVNPSLVIWLVTAVIAVGMVLLRGCG